MVADRSSSVARAWVALLIVCVWAASYVAATIDGKTELVAIGSPVMLVAAGYLLGGEIVRRK